MPEEKPKKRRGTGHLFQKSEGGLWHLQYYRPNAETGKSERVRENTHTQSRTAAQRMLNSRLTQVARGEPFDVGRRTTVGMLYKSLRVFTENNARGARSVSDLGGRWNHLKPAFGHIPATNVSTDSVERYKKQRRAEGAAPATVNRELATLRRMFNHGRKDVTPPLVHSVPPIKLFREDNVRTGFVDDAQFGRLAEEALKDGLWMRLLIGAAYLYGWRKGELLTLRVRQVDFDNLVLRLEVGTTKNGEGREVFLDSSLVELFRAACENKKPDDFVLTRENGEPVRDFRGAWRNLCIRAGLGAYHCADCNAVWNGKRCECGSRKRKHVGLIPHDFRRSAARNMRRANVAENVAMRILGHKTRSMFDRYNIVNNDDTRRAMEALAEARKANSPSFNPSDQKEVLEDVVTEVLTNQ